MTRSSVSFLLLLSGCALLDPPSQYYAGGWDPPQIDALSVASETGNIGGGTLDLVGGNFGTDPNDLVVLFGEHNAEILDIADDRVTVRIPNGPLTGGDVTVSVAGPNGYSAAPTLYRYDVGTVTDNQIGFVQINNYWESCYGGMSTRLDDEWGQAFGCEDIAYIGMTGIDGTADRYNFAYPRVHTPLMGFMGGTDQGGEDWQIERPGQLGFTFGVDNLHEDVGPITLRSPFWADEGEEVCVDVDAMAVFRYGGGDLGFLDPAAATESPNGVPFEISDVDACADKGGVLYDASVMEFCTSDDAEGIPTYTYRSDWPVARNFFAGHRTKLKPATVTMDAPTVGIAGQEIALPESIVARAIEGFAPASADFASADDLWSLIPVSGCYDDSGNGEDLRDTALAFTWEPSTVDFTQSGAVIDSHTYVRVTLSTLFLNWFGTTAFPVRATVVVPDANAVDDEGLSHIEIPARVMYQLPTVQVPQGQGYLASTTPDWGYLIIEFQRVTEYTIETASGNVVFSYTTGDFTFSEWLNPTDGDGCHNCLDDDEDGYADADDPDCSGAGTEEVGFGETACNDGVDNDRDGDEDGADELCVDAADDDESNCSNSRDDDRDGLTDEEDPECGRGNETNDDSSCGNGDDDDGDGWIDEADPDCAEGTEVGLTAAECNDGADNDVDGLTDAEDPECVDATGTEGAPDPTSCLDGLDDDLDGWTDAEDPDCALGDYELGYGADVCNNGADDDKDGVSDAADPDCESATDSDEAISGGDTGDTGGA